MATSVKEIKQNDRYEQVKYMARRNEALGYLALIKRGRKNLVRGKLHYFKGGARAAMGGILILKAIFF